VSISAGLAARATLSVTDGDTAAAMRSGDVPVLGTPRLVALCEEACCQAVVGALPDGATTVGMRVQLDHLSPTRVGSEVTADATLERVEGRRLTFVVAANDPGGLIGAGRMTRVVVDVRSFLERAH
jgi:fluoroacetyl-CoA thioesterase